MLSVPQLRDYRPSDKAVTSMVSFHIPASYSLDKLREKLTKEIASAANIKSRVNRQSVQTALVKVQDYLKTYRGSTPSTGMALFAEQYI